MPQDIKEKIRTLWPADNAEHLTWAVIRKQNIIFWLESQFYVEVRGWQVGTDPNFRILTA